MKKLLLLSTFLITSFLSAQSYYFNGSVSTDPNDTANWDGGTTPSNINSQIASNETVYVNAGATFDAPMDLYIAGTLINEGTVNLTASFASTLNSATIENNNNGIINVSGYLESYGPNYIYNNDNAVFNLNAYMDNIWSSLYIFNTGNSTFNIQSGYSLSLTDFSSFSNSQTATVNNSGTLIINNSDFLNTNSATFNNLSNGSVNITNFASFSNDFGSTINNANLIDIYTSVFSNSGTLNNTLTSDINVEQSSLINYGGFIYNYNDTTIDFINNSFLNNEVGGVINNFDLTEITINNSTFTSLSNSVLNNNSQSKFWLFNNSTANVNDYSLINNNDNSMIYMSTSTFNNQNNSVVNNNLTSQINIYQSNFVNTGSAIVNNNNSSIVIVGSNGNFINYDNSALNNYDFGSVSVYTGSNLNNNDFAQITNTDNATMTVDDIFTNSTNATFTNNSIFNSNGSINNQGTIKGNNQINSFGINNYGTVSPGNSAGKYVTDYYNNYAGGSVNIEIYGTGNLSNAGITYDTIEVVQNNTINDGILNVTLPTNYNPAVGEEFYIFNVGNNNSANNFSVLNLPTLVNKEFVIVYDTTNIRLVVESTLSTNQFNAEQISIYPNPSTDFINIKGLKTPENIQIFNINGQKVIETSSIQSVDVSRLSNGVYFLKLKGNSLKFIKK